MKKLLSISLVLLLLVGCSSSNYKKTDDSINQEVTSFDINDSTLSGAYFLKLLKNYNVKEKNSTKEDNEEFDAFLDEVFNQITTSNYLYMHSNVTDYKTMGLTKPEVTWGDINYGLDIDEITIMIDQYNKLMSFDYDSLSLRQQYDYDTFKYSLLESLCGAYFCYYSLIFSDYSSVSDGIITNLMEFKFYDEESVEDYITLLKELPDYIDKCIEYSKKQSENGLYHTDTMLDSEVDYIKSIIDDDGQSLIESFETNSAFQDKHDEIASLIKYDVCSAFNTLYEYIQTLYSKAEDSDLQLCNIDSDYAEYMFIVNTSNNCSIEDMFTALFTYYANTVNDFVDAYQANENLYDEYDLFIGNNESEPLNLDGNGMLEYLRNNTSERYKKIDVSYAVSQLSTLGSSTAGYYVNPPLDDLNQNIIRLNPKFADVGTGISNYEILAHEGFPGHLYQHYYYMQTNPHNFRSTQTFIGYIEGYADLAAMDALELLDYPSSDMIYCAKLESTILNSHVVYSIIDIAVNYLGYDLDDVADLMEKMGLVSDYAEMFYKSVISMPTIFTRYGVGFVSQYNLRENAKSELGDKFDYVSYSNAILENGPVPFAILEGEVDKYINENK